MEPSTPRFRPLPTQEDVSRFDLEDKSPQPRRISPPAVRPQQAETSQEDEGRLKRIERKLDLLIGLIHVGVEDRYDSVISRELLALVNSPRLEEQIDDHRRSAIRSAYGDDSVFDDDF